MTKNSYSVCLHVDKIKLFGLKELQEKSRDNSERSFSKTAYKICKQMFLTAHPRPNSKPFEYFRDGRAKILHAHNKLQYTRMLCRCVVKARHYGTTDLIAVVCRCLIGKGWLKALMKLTCRPTTMSFIRLNGTEFLSFERKSARIFFVIPGPINNNKGQ